MIHNGMTGQQIAYNDLDLVRNIEASGATLVNYSYLADGTKLSATDAQGEGLVYRGAFVYRRGADSSLTLESAGFSGGRLTGTSVLMYATDYLGSVRAVVDGRTGELYKAVDYSAYGEETTANNVITTKNSGSENLLETASIANGLTLRDGYTGKENQHLDFGTHYTDFGARQYHPQLHRWMTPDPLSEKYYGISPYAFCNNDPVNFVDLDGEFPLLSNFVGGFVSAGVEYGSQVIGNILSGEFSADDFTNVDLFDIGVAFGEGFITSGTNVARKVITKATVELTGEIARNAVDIKIGSGTDHTPKVNSFGDVIVDTAIGVASEVLNADVNISPFKGESGTKAVRAAREAADESLSPQVADGVRKYNSIVNAEKSAANQAVSEGAGSVRGSVTGDLLKRLNDDN
jgi:RHS repeat-associated protein